MAMQKPTSPLVPAPHSPGMYRITFYVVTRVASALASMTVNATYSDGASRTRQALTLDLSSLGAVQQGMTVIYSDGTQDVGFTVGFLNRGNSAFDAWVNVEAL